ncbi:acetamidase/formamidase family protein [Holdemania massiliensis]|uniref:acetamidase/formamidase family protein n=1 Tax=Holdemania massiliensis TaxID=1468449 RepID=UPI0036F258C5
MKKIAKDQVIYAMSSENKPVLKAHSGDRICFETRDCYGDEITPQDPDRRPLQINPATGPVFVEEAQVGDTLKVTIEKITLQDQALVGSYPKSGMMADWIERRMIHFLPVQENQLEFQKDLVVKTAPMIGVIGVAPESESVECRKPGVHGGNMDCRKIREGSVVYLPVFHPGALLALGDVHAAMGDGEVMGSGAEIAANVTVQIEVIKETCGEPWVVDRDRVYVITSAETMEEALKQGCYKMNQRLQKQLGLSPEMAGMLMSLEGNSEICQVVNPFVTLRIGMPLVRFLSKEGKRS